MHYIYDFDYTLYTTNRPWERWLLELEQAGISREEAETCAQSLFLTCFTPRRHAELLGKKGRELERMLKGLAAYEDQAGEDLLYEDVRAYLEGKANGYKQSVLTFGDPDYQSRKVDLTGISELLDDIRVATPDMPKVDHIRELIETGSDPIVFIDDNPRELIAVYESGLPVELVRMLREGARHIEPHEGDNEHWRCITTLDEVNI